MAYQLFLNKKPSILLEDLVYTANMGRTHLNYRIGFIVNSLEDLGAQLRQGNFMTGKSSSDKKITIEFSYVTKGDFEISTEAAEMEKVIINIGPEIHWKEFFEKLRLFYLEGARIDWSGLYKPFNFEVQTIPDYPFQSTHFWAEFLEKNGFDKK